MRARPPPAGAARPRGCSFVLVCVSLMVVCLGCICMMAVAAGKVVCKCVWFLLTELPRLLLDHRRVVIIGGLILWSVRKYQRFLHRGLGLVLRYVAFRVELVRAIMACLEKLSPEALLSYAEFIGRAISRAARHEDVSMGVIVFSRLNDSVQLIITRKWDESRSPDDWKAMVARRPTASDGIESHVLRGDVSKKYDSSRKAFPVKGGGWARKELFVALYHHEDDVVSKHALEILMFMTDNEVMVLLRDEFSCDASAARLRKILRLDKHTAGGVSKALCDLLNKTRENTLEFQIERIKLLSMLHNKELVAAHRTCILEALTGGEGDRRQAAIMVAVTQGNHLIDRTGDWPLHVLARGGHLDICRCLVESGVLSHPLNHSGLAPVDLAQRNGHRETAVFLRSRQKLTTMRGGLGDAYDEAMSDMRRVVRVQWGMIYLPGTVGLVFGGKHSVLGVTVRSPTDDADEMVYAIEKAARVRGSASGDTDRFENGVHVSYWADVVPNLHGIEHTLEQSDMCHSAHEMCFSHLHKLAVASGPYDVASANCHHAVQAMYNACARPGHHEWLPNLGLITVAQGLQALGINVAESHASQSALRFTSMHDLGASVVQDFIEQSEYAEARSRLSRWYLDKERWRTAAWDAKFEERRNPDRGYNSAQIKEQDHIVSNMTRHAIKSTAPFVIFLAGGPGSGKGFALKWLRDHAYYPVQHAVLDIDEARYQSSAWAINADDSPEGIAKLVDATQAGAGFVCEVAALRCAMQSKSFVYDSTLRIEGWASEFIRLLKEVQPRLRICILFIDSPVDACKVRAHERFLKEKRNVPETFIESCNAASRATVASLRDSVHLYMHVHNDSLQVPPHAAEDTPPEMLPKFIKHVELGQQTCWFGCLR
mmetsp:Transcript_51674/g.167846  ORF Transcript_51674/g.167846 Transcript_51674/m.167846 type:complete len:883 (-) Transcript_51674:399-3047(-)